MISITVKHDHITIQGHSQADICAAISSIMYTSINILMRIDETCISYKDCLETEEKKDEVVIDLLKHGEIVDMVYGNMISMFEDVSIDNPDEVKIIDKTKEVD